MIRFLAGTVLLASVSVTAGEKGPAFRYGSSALLSAQARYHWQQQEDPHFRKKKVAQALLFSAVIPGLGQASNGSWLKAGAFLLAEAGLIYYYSDQKSSAEAFEDQFEAFADQYWSEDVYWNAIAQESGIDRSDMAALREYERKTFSHYLPERKNQTYYENIGKYDQFNIGWVDTETHRGRDSELRLEYAGIRRESNDAFDRARMAASFTMLNHIVSALDAAFFAHRKFAGAQVKLAFDPKMRSGRSVPALALRVTW